MPCLPDASSITTISWRQLRRTDTIWYIRSTATVTVSPATTNIISTASLEAYTCWLLGQRDRQLCSRKVSYLIGDIAEKRFCLLRSMISFRDLSRSCIVLKRQKISTSFLLHMTAPYLSQITLKFGLHRSTPSTQILSQSDPPLSETFDGLIEHGFTSAPTQYRLYGWRFLQVWWPNQQCQSTEGGWLVIQRGLNLTMLTTCMQILHKKII